MNLEFDILNELAEGELRPSKIRERLLPKYKKKHNYSKRSFDVIILRLLSGKLSKCVNRSDRGHQQVYYSLNQNGFKEVERMRLKARVNNWIDEMSFTEIRTWLASLEARGTRLFIPRGGVVRDKKGKIKGKAIGIVGGEVRTKKRADKLS